MEHLNNSFFKSDDLTFTATVILLGKVVIERVSFHPVKQNVKIFYLSPKAEVEKLYRLYVSDRLQVSPQRLNSKISAIRHMPAEEVKE